MKWCRNKSSNQKQFIPSLAQQRAEKLAEIGDLLRQHREQQHLSLEKVAAVTRMQRRLLKAIELGQLQELPEPIYIQMFIKKYADLLGLDGTALSHTFPIENQQQTNKSSQIILPLPQLRPIHLYLLYLVVIGCAVNALSQSLSRSELQATNLQEPQKLVVTQQPWQQSAIKSVSATESESTADNQLKISVTLKAKSWIRIVADGKTQFEGILPVGTQRTWVAREQLTVKASNAGGVLVTFNQQAKQIGNPGQVGELTFTRGQGSGVRGQGSGVRDQGSGIRGQGSGVRGQGRVRN